MKNHSKRTAMESVKISLHKHMQVIVENHKKYIEKCIENTLQNKKKLKWDKNSRNREEICVQWPQ